MKENKKRKKRRANIVVEKTKKHTKYYWGDGKLCGNYC